MCPYKCPGIKAQDLCATQFWQKKYNQRKYKWKTGCYKFVWWNYEQL